MSITFSPKAEAFMRRMVRMGGSPAAGFRLEVSPGGCSGLAAQFDVESAPATQDVVMETNGIRVFMSPGSRQLLEGATVDFVDTRTDSGFNIITPNAATACASSAASLPAVVSIEISRIRHSG
jgi:iron-sulfur cluster assembly protein